MPERRRPWAVAGAVLIVALAGGALMLRTGPARRYPYMHAEGPRSEGPPAGWAERFIDVGEGVRLRAFERPGRDRLLFMDGNGSAPLQEGAARLLALLPPDVGVTLVAPRGFDGSSGTLTPETLAHDAQRLRTLTPPAAGQSLLVGGFSLGTIFALAAADGRAEVCTLLLAPLTDIGISRGGGRIMQRLRLDRYDSRAVRLPGPALAIRGAQDTDSLAQDLAAVSSMGGQVTTLTAQKVGHADLHRAPEVKSAVQTFVERCRSTVTGETP